MDPATAQGLVQHSSLTDAQPQTWADLGCGDGTFTRALAAQLATGSVIHALDQDARALSRLGRHAHGIEIVPHVGDFSAPPWPFDRLDGILMANALHYVRNQRAFVEASLTALRRHRWLLVEYDTDQANPWVPFPLDKQHASQLFREAGFSRLTALGSAPSRYRRSDIYGLLAEA